MPKTTKSYMVRRGRRYLIERTAEGTFSRWIPVGGAKKTAKKSAAKATTKSAAKATIKSAAKSIAKGAKQGVKSVAKNIKSTVKRTVTRKTSGVKTSNKPVSRGKTSSTRSRARA